MHFLSPDQQSGIHCLIICEIQLLTPNNFGRTWRPIHLWDVGRGVSALLMLRNHAVQIDIYLLFGGHRDGILKSFAGSLSALSLWHVVVGAVWLVHALQ